MEPVDALIRLILLGAMILLLVGGFLVMLIVWYTRGRDPQVGMIADSIAEPPDDLPPGAVGTLVDEHVDHHDVVATLIGLGRNGAVTIAPEGDDWLITAVDVSGITTKLERDLLRVLFNGDPGPGTQTRLFPVRKQFEAHKEQIRTDLYAELVNRGYFDASPEHTRRLWARRAKWGIALSVVVGAAVAIIVDPVGWATMIAAVIAWSMLWYMSRHMPRKTSAGAEAAAKWRAFGNHLRDISRRKDVPEAQVQFERFLPYAVALKIDREFVKAFARHRTEAPRWYGTPGGGDVIIMGDGVPGWGSGGSVSAPDLDLPNVGVPDFGMPDVQGLSDAVGGGLDSASGGLFDLFDSAGSIFDGIDFDIDFDF